jgi:hypothetical protein
MGSVAGLRFARLEMPPPPLCIIREVERDGADQRTDVALQVDETSG